MPFCDGLVHEVRIWQSQTVSPLWFPFVAFDRPEPFAIIASMSDASFIVQHLVPIASLNTLLFSSSSHLDVPDRHG